MMDPAVKTAMAVCVLLGGFCAATLFRRERAEPPVAPSPDEQLLLHCPTETLAPLPAAGHGRAGSANRERARTAASRRRATIVTLSEQHEPPPSLASDYPEPQPMASPPWRDSMDRTADEPRTHKVVDGDTLAALAERYLGAPDKAQDIYEANRNVLHDPMLLPIGVELKLPPRSRQASPQGSLVPVSPID